MDQSTKKLNDPVLNAVNPDYSKERKLNFFERIYLPEIFKGLWYTFKQIFQPKVTMRYPEERFNAPDIFRGRPVLVEDNGQERCVACGLCARACPPLAISMQASEISDDPKERYPEMFEINMLRCIYCGYCEEVCPEEAIVMSKDYDLTFPDREEAVYDKSKLLVPKEELEDRLNYLREYKNRQFGNFWKFDESNNVHSVRNRDQRWKTSLALVEMIENKQKDENT